MFSGLIQKEERKVVAGQLEEVAQEIKDGRFKKMSPQLLKWIEGFAWAAALGAIPVLQDAFTAGTFGKQTWSLAASAAFIGGAAYLRRQEVPTKP